MNRMSVCLVVILGCLCSPLLAQQRAAPKRTPKAADSPTGVTASVAPISESPQPPSSRVVAYTKRDVMPLRAKLRYTTLIVLPEGERILDYTCGDKDWWVVNGNQNLAYIKPAKA